MEKRNTHILRLVGVILGSTLAISLLILLTGYIYQWDKPVQFSNAFFVVGAFVIVLGVLSVSGGLTQRGNFNMMYAETAGQANQAERNQRWAAEITQRYGTMIILLATGVLLIGMAVAIGKFLIK
jgi:hypothetical protein